MNSSPTGTAPLDRPAYAYPYASQPPVQQPPAKPPEPPQPPFGPAAAPQPRPRRGKAAAMAGIVALVLAGGASGGVAAAAWDHAGGAPAAAGATPATNAATVDADRTLSGVAARLMPSVVTITVRDRTGEALGSGVILGADGLIVTNAHVVSSGGTMNVLLADGSTLPATLVGQDTAADVAVLRATGAANLTPATLGDSDSLRVGDTVLAFGSPLGLSSSVTSGIVSALHRDTTAGGAERSGNSIGSGSAGNMIQTDAAINEGNSGGPLVDTAGRVVGIDTAIFTTGQSSGNIGLGFAIPINTVKSVVDRLVQNS